MEQLGLNIIPRLAYSADNYVVHSGVATLLDSVLRTLENNSYSLSWITGPPRMGKTHLSIYLTHLLSQRGLLGRLLVGNDLTSWLDSRYNRPSIVSCETIIINDMQDFFLGIGASNSDRFVALVEELRNVKGKLVLLSSQDMEKFSCDEHTMSRLKSGFNYKLGNLADGELPLLIAAMGRQRGLALEDRQISYVSKRLRRDIPSIENYLSRVNLLSNTLNKSISRPILSNAL